MPIPIRIPLRCTPPLYWPLGTRPRSTSLRSMYAAVLGHVVAQARVQRRSLRIRTSPATRITTTDLPTRFAGSDLISFVRSISPQEKDEVTGGPRRCAWQRYVSGLGRRSLPLQSDRRLWAERLLARFLRSIFLDDDSDLQSQKKAGRPEGRPAGTAGPARP